MATARRGTTFAGANVFLSRSLVPPDVFDALHDALKLNGATVFLCSDPSRTAANDYHVIASSNHEKFENLRAKGCNLLGPQCILSCAKEYRNLPKQGYTCCLSMDGVKILASGFDKDEKIQIEQLVTAMGGVLHTKASQDVNFVIVKNVLAAKYKWALNILKKPIVTMSWLRQCWTEHRVVPQEAYRILPFSGLTICVTRIPADERKEMEKLIIDNGGSYSADLTKKCSHLISDSPQGDKYMVARRWGYIHIVTHRWIDQSIVRRACLDEALFPVQLNSVSCNDVKRSQKERRCQELSNTNSQTVSPLMFGDVEATLSQNVSSSFSDATKVNNEGTDSAVILMKDEQKLDTCIIDDLESDDYDLYLSDCRISLVGFSEAELSKLLNMIIKGGGTRHMSLSEKLTHIIIGEPSDSEKKEVRHLAACGVINVVKATWLEECNKTKEALPISTRHLASELIFSKDSTCYATESSTAKVENFAAIPSVSASHHSDKFRAELFSEKRTKNNVNGSLSKIAINAEISNPCSAGKSLSQGIQKHGPYSRNLGTQIRGPSNTFKGKHFCFSSSFPQERRAEIIEWVMEGGGTMINDQSKMNANYMIECHGIVHAPVDCSQIVVSTHWIRSCLEDAHIQDVGSHIIYSPLRCHIPLSGFESLRFCVSQYEEKERLLLRNLCFTLGAKFTEKLTKKVTHLLCKFATGPKYEAACRWGIQSITFDWIKECIFQDMIISLDPFRPKPVSDEDLEAGLCTLSQYPTQSQTAQISGIPSQLVSESLESKKNTTKRAGLCEKDVGICRKSLRLSECRTNTDAAKKNRIPENSLISNDKTVPDFADAIEYLLAQSPNIQDMKSPQQSGCGQGMFSSDHSIICKGNESSSSTFGVSKHWMNKTADVMASAASSHEKVNGNYAFSETQTDSQVVVYEDDLSGRQKIIDRVKSQSMNLTPDGSNQL
ncbi:DNA topoisomerase 2-binding protein 1-like isoform X3 [Zingiber officinale]|uniref:DNA topoisomerase 2-binding protein 1-like isoform X3 n=1 Tax=Zingiber officinale TaxID=94328 RepID=UPI001C4BF526|nr:DNA topoisomerase 2-binding protein 1-like isoform X3 [Zingiber officinale]